MRILLSPQVAAGPGEGGPAAASLLAGPEGSVVSLLTTGVRTLGRVLTAAEVSAIRQALLGGEVRPEEERIVGYVCRGTRLGAGGTTGGRAGADGAAVAPEAGSRAGRMTQTVAVAEAGSVPHAFAVSDHVNLTWRSPLTGPNDDRLGPRFPSMSGVYAPEAVVGRLASAGGIIVAGVVAGADDEDRLSPFEAGVAAASGCVAASRELVPVVILAAHLGLRVAALVVTVGYE